MNAKLQKTLNYIESGRFSDSEVVIGLVGAIGTNLNSVVEDLITMFNHCGYDAREVRISNEVIRKHFRSSHSSEKSEYERLKGLMNAGNKARESTRDNSVLALGAAVVVYGHRGDSPSAFNRRAYIVNSLKHPAEVKALRHIYGDGFFLIGVHSEHSRRLQYLCDEKQLTEDQAKELTDRDEAEVGKGHGQRTRDTYHLADFFVHLDSNEDRRKEDIRRILKLLFGHPNSTPLFDEFAMFMAFSASLRSADLSRQVGAVVAKGNEIVSMGSNDAPCYGGGLYWPYRDTSSANVADIADGRDYMRKVDSNDHQKEILIDQLVEGLDSAKLLSKSKRQAKQYFKHSPVDDITEYGRVVH